MSEESDLIVETRDFLKKRDELIGTVLDDWNQLDSQEKEEIGIMLKDLLASSKKLEDRIKKRG